MVCQRVSGYCISLIHSLKYCVESVLGLGLEGIIIYCLWDFAELLEPPVSAAS